MARAAETLKVTFTLDSTTIDAIEEAAEILKKPKSQVVRGAVLEFRSRLGRFTETEKVERLRKFDQLLAGIPKRDAAGVKNELKEIRLARRGSGRASKGE